MYPFGLKDCIFLLVQPFLGFPYWYTIWSFFSLVHCFYAGAVGIRPNFAQDLWPFRAILWKMGRSWNQWTSRLSWGPEIAQNLLGNPILGGSSWRPVSAPLGYNFSIWPILSQVHFYANSILIIWQNCGTFTRFCRGSRVLKHTIF